MLYTPKYFSMESAIKEEGKRHMSKRSKRKSREIPTPLLVVQKMSKVSPYRELYPAFDVAGSREKVTEILDAAISQLFHRQSELEISIEEVSRNSYEISIARLTWNWMLYKQIYKFDSDLLDVLHLEETDAIPVDILGNCPVDTFFLEPDNMFVRIDKTSKGYLLELASVTENFEILNYRPLLLRSGESLSGSIDCLLDDLTKLAPQMETKELTDRYDSSDFKRVLPQILYLCTQNADIKEQEKPQTKNEPAQKKASSPRKKNKSESIKTFDVGVTITRDFAHAKTQVVRTDHDRSTSSSWTQRPHVRRAHWHSFWTGPKSDPMNRKLVVRWVPPVFVNKDLGQASPVTVNEIK